MEKAAINITVEGEDFCPIIDEKSMAVLAAAFKRWVDAGKPPYIPAENQP